MSKHQPDPHRWCSRMTTAAESRVTTTINEFVARKIALAAVDEATEDPSFFYIMVADVFAGRVTDPDAFRMEDWTGECQEVW